MDTHGLFPNPSVAGGPPPLSRDVAALRIDLPTRLIVAVSPALAQLAGRAANGLVGRQHTEVWSGPERAAIARRLDDVVLLGRDVFGAVVLAPDGADPVWVEVEAHYRYEGGQRLDVMLRAVDAPRPPPPPQVPLLRRPVLPAMQPARPVSRQVAPDSRPRVSERPAPVVSIRGTRLSSTTRSQPAPAVSVAIAPMPAPNGAGPALSYVVMTALGAASAAALAIEAGGRVASATPEAERMLGTPIARLRGATIQDFLTLPDFAAEALAAAQMGRSRQSVAATLAQDGRAVAVDWVPCAEPDIGFIIMAFDKPETEDGERLRLQSRLVSFVAHDVRNSLAAVYCGLRTMADLTRPEGPERPTLDRILTETRRASRIVDDILAVSRPGRLVRVELELNSLLRDTLTRFRSRAAANGTEIRDALGEPVHILADLSQLERAFDNLIENALQATPHYGTLTVATQLETRSRPGVRITIADTGVGIKPDVRANIFEPFVTDKPNGTGLGLAITRRVILDHEGQIDFDTEEGRGTTFTIWLPQP
jgi:signal transduction histidine kinase